MAVVEQVFGENVFMYISINGGTSTLIGCGKGITVNGTRKELDTTCSDSGDTETARTGKAKYTWDIDVIWRQTNTALDDADNITAYDLVAAFKNKHEVSIVIKDNGTLTAGEESYTGVGQITNFKLSGMIDSVESFTCSGFFNSFATAKVAYA